MVKLDLESDALIAAIKEEFSKSDLVPTAEEIARLYGVMAAQHEVSMAMFALVMKVRPDLVFTPEVTAVRQAMDAFVSEFRDALLDLAKTPQSEREG